EQPDAARHHLLLERRADVEEPVVLLPRAEAEYVLDARAVVTASVEDHDLPRGREVREIALHVHLALLPVRRRRQRHYPEHAWADALGEGLDRAALAAGVAALEHDHDPLAGGLHPLLQVAELDLQLTHLLLVALRAQLVVPLVLLFALLVL